MNVIVIAAGAAALFGILLLLFARWSRRQQGLGPGETVALDDVTLYSPRLKLVGRPDRIVKEGGTFIPEEWKSSKRMSHGHRLQLGTYFLLIEEEYGVQPPFGVVVLGDGSRVTVQNTEKLRAEVLLIAAKIRERRAKLGETVPVDQPVNKCRRCGQQANCTQANT